MENEAESGDNSSDGRYSDLEMEVNQIMNNVFGDGGPDDESDTNMSTDF